MRALWSGLLRWRWAAAGFAAVAAFAVLAGRFWHPYYGFTKFIQLDEADHAAGIHEVREYPVFYYAGFNGYDGAAYAQIAFHPLLDSPELPPAIDNLNYRARRILGSALAWVLSAGRPERIAHTYAALNLVVWLAFAALLWRVLPVCDARSWLAWVGVLFSAGALHSVRLALTDLLATTLVTGAIWIGERGRPGRALAILGVSGLARETALLNVVALWRRPWDSPRALATNALRTVGGALPLLAWIAYVRWKAGPAPQGFGNFSWPIVGWIEKWRETFTAYARQSQFWWLNTTTLLALIGLTVQAAYFLWPRVPARSTTPRARDPWWRAGIASVAMMALLGTAVWEGNPGAATRVLLPMSVAFAVFAVRERASARWIGAGSLGVFSGVLALWHVPEGAAELSTGRFAGGSYVVRPLEGWYGVERTRRASWAWSSGRGALVIETAPRATTEVRVRLRARALMPRPLEIRSGNDVVWHGELRPEATWLDFQAKPQEGGRVTLELSSPAPPVRESDQPEARALSFAIYRVEIE